MPASESLNKAQFRANKSGKSMRYGGKWVNPTSEALQEIREAARERHGTIDPIKDTLGTHKINWSTFKGHINRNKSSYGVPAHAKEVNQWAADTHANNPELFNKIVNDIKGSN